MPPEESLKRLASGQSDPSERALLEAHLYYCPESEELTKQISDSDIELEDWDRKGEANETTLEIILSKIKANGGNIINTQAEKSDVPIPPSVLSELIPPGEWQWHSLWPCRGRIALVQSGVLGHGLYCIHLKAGAVTPTHQHLCREESVIISGGYSYDGKEFNIGDYDVLEKGSVHAPVVFPDSDCWALVRQAVRQAPKFVGFSAWRRPIVSFARHFLKKPGV